MLRSSSLLIDKFNVKNTHRKPVADSPKCNQLVGREAVYNIFARVLLLTPLVPSRFIRRGCLDNPDVVLGGSQKRGTRPFDRCIRVSEGPSAWRELIGIGGHS